MMSVDYRIMLVKGTIIFVMSKGTDRFLKKTVSRQLKYFSVFVSSHGKNTNLVSAFPYPVMIFSWFHHFVLISSLQFNQAMLQRPFHFFVLLSLVPFVFQYPKLCQPIPNTKNDLQDRMFRCDKGKITIRSEAPLETIQASSNQLKGIIDAKQRNFAWSIEIKTLKGFNSPLQQEHFNENYMETTLYPTASFTGKIIENINFDTDGTYNIRAKGILEIHGVRQERIVKVRLDVKKSNIILHSDFTIALEEHNIAIPRVVHQKIATDVQVTVDAVLKAGS